jgi:hypothetical protein
LDVEIAQIRPQKKGFTEIKAANHAISGTGCLKGSTFKPAID